MKKLKIFLLGFVFVFLSYSPTLAGKFGINIGDHYNEFDLAARTVGSEGWVYVMTCPGEGDKIAEMINSHPEVNIVIRGQYPGDRPEEELAISWAATIGSLPDNGKRIFFMPWNEPNGPGADDEIGAEVLNSYINHLIKALNESGVRERVFLLSPMINIFNPGARNYANQLRELNSGFFEQFDGIAMNLYGQYSNFLRNGGRLTSDVVRNGQGYEMIMREWYGVNKPVLALETGVAIVGQTPFVRYGDAQAELIDYYSFVKERWSKDGNLKMFSIFSYDPLGDKSAWIYGARGVIETMREIGPGASFSVGSRGVGSGFEKWKEEKGVNLCEGTKHAWAVFGYCGGCGSWVEKQIFISNRIVDPGNDLAFSLSDPVRLYQNFSLPPGYSETMVKTRGGFFENFKDLEIPFAQELTKYFLGPFAYQSNTKIKEYIDDLEENKERLGVLSHLLPEEVQDKHRKAYQDKCASGEYCSSVNNCPDENNECLIASGKGIEEIVPKPDPKNFTNLDDYYTELENWRRAGYEKEWVQIPLVANPLTEVSLEMRANLPAIHMNACPGNEDAIAAAGGSSNVKIEVPWVSALKDAANILYEILTPEEQLSGKKAIEELGEKEKKVETARAETYEKGVVLAQAEEKPGCMVLSCQATADKSGYGTEVDYFFRVTDINPSHGIHVVMSVNGIPLYGGSPKPIDKRNTGPWETKREWTPELPIISLSKGESETVQFTANARDCDSGDVTCFLSCTFSLDMGGNFSKSCSGNCGGGKKAPYVCRPPDMPAARRGYGDLIEVEGHARLYGPQKSLSCQEWVYNPETQRLDCNKGNDTYEVNDPVWAVIKYPYLNTIYSKISGPNGVLRRIFKPEDIVLANWNEAGETDIAYCFSPYEKYFPGTSVIAGGWLGPYDYNDPEGVETEKSFPSGSMARCEKGEYTEGLGAYPEKIGGVKNAQEWVVMCSLSPYEETNPICMLE